MTDETYIEYRIVPVTRYIVSRFAKNLSPCRTGELVEGQGSETRGEFNNEDTAYAVAYALAKADHDRIGWPIDDERIQYPRYINSGKEKARLESVQGIPAGPDSFPPEAEWNA